VILFLFSFSASLKAQFEEESKYIYQIIQFTNWTESNFKSNHYINLAIYNNRELAMALSSFFEKKDYSFRKIHVKNLDNLEGLNEFDILYLSENETCNFTEVVKFCNKYKVLSIGFNKIDFCENGGIVNFAYKRTQLIIQINYKAALLNNFYFSPQLLNIAEIIE